MTIMEWFGADDGWERPRPPVGRHDVRLALVVLVVVSVCVELMRSFSDLGPTRPLWVEYLTVIGLCLLMLWRRAEPLLVCVLGFALFFVTVTWVPEIGYQVFYQYAFFFLLYSAVAWARDRRATALVMTSLAVFFFLWVAWDFALGQSIDHFREARKGVTSAGLFSPVVAYVVYVSLLNVIYMLGAIGLGQAAWRQARNEARLAEQAETIAAQAATLREQAVVDERLRIARELHDVVAHHVSVMGIQAAGARRLLEKRPDLAAEALGNVEESSRQAVTQMRSLLGALRGTETGTGVSSDREPQPNLASLPELYRSMEESGLRVRSSLVEDPPGSAEQLPLPIQLSLYRCVQEALTNVSRHSTAREASVALRVSGGGDGWAEVEVLDDGRPRSGTSGTGLGLLGMRERMTSHGGTLEIGPRVTGGYRVRVRLPLGSARMPVGAPGTGSAGTDRTVLDASPAPSPTSTHGSPEMTAATAQDIR